MNEIDFSQTPSATDESKAKKIGKIAIWTLFGLSFFVIFTAWRVADTRLKNLLESQVQNSVRQMGYQLTFDDSTFSVLAGFRYQLDRVQLRSIGMEEGIRLDSLRLSPSFSSLLSAKIGADFRLLRGAGDIDGTLSIRKNDFRLKTGLNSIDIGEVGLLQALARIQARGKVSGSIDIQGETKNPGTWSGHAKIQAKGFQIEKQNLLGLDLPEAIQISEIELDGPVQQGRLQLKTARIGKPGDDVNGNITGDVTLAANVYAGKMNINLKFALSRKVLDKLSFLDIMLSSAKQSDGSYAFQCVGSLGFPNCTAIAGGR